MPSEPKWKVGDSVVVEVARMSTRPNQAPRIEHEIVTKVARKYFYTSQPESKGRWDERGFEIETGIQKPRDPNYTNYLDHAYTPAEWEEKQLRDELFARISELNKEIDTEISWRWSGKKKWSTARLMELRMVLEGVAADKEVVSLD